MLDSILNNPHYIMYGMIAVFLIVVIGLIVVASQNARKPSSYEPTPHIRPPERETSLRSDDGDTRGPGASGSRPSNRRQNSQD